MMIIIGILAALMVMLVVINTLALWHFSKRFDKVCYAINRDLHNMQQSFRTVSQGMTGIGKNIVMLEKQFNQISLQTQEIAEIAQSEPTESGYQHARQLLRRGADIEEVIQTCGLSRAEAELISQIKTQEDSQEHFDSLEEFFDVEAHKQNNMRKNLRGF